jgi:protease PrsW
MVWWAIAAAFPVLWIWAFYREDRLEREPPWMLGVAFLLGCVAIIPARVLENVFLPHGLGSSDTLLARSVGVLLIAGPIEELCKFAPVRLHIYHWAQFNEPMDGILYSVATAIGFATAENVLYMIDPAEGPHVILARGPAATFAHLVFAGFWGSALGWSKFMTDRRAARFMVAVGLLWAFVTHGLFDLISFSVNHEISVFVARGLLLLLMGASYLALRRQMTRAIALSPFRPQ